MRVLSLLYVVPASFRAGGRILGVASAWMFVAFQLLSGKNLRADQEISADICVYGGTSGGVIAAVKAARLGKHVALICDKNHLGGMTSSGLGWTDVGHVGTAYIQGMANEFYTRLNSADGRNVNYASEPHVAETVFNTMVQQAGVKIYTNLYLTSATMQGQQ